MLEKQYDHLIFVQAIDNPILSPNQFTDFRSDNLWNHPPNVGKGLEPIYLIQQAIDPIECPIRIIPKNKSCRLLNLRPCQW